nr:hypothetical protein [Bacillus sp. B15-48]
MYFIELGASRVGDKLLYMHDGENKWCGEILKEEEISFTPVFKVNTVMVRFSAKDEATLEELIKNYRYKTTRIGG